MRTIPLIELAWQLKRAGIHPDEIATQCGVHRATVYRWIAGINKHGIQLFLRQYKAAKKGHRQKRRTDWVTVQRVLEIRSEWSDCCGEKIHYWMKKRHGYSPSRTTIYRILNQYAGPLRSKWKKSQKRGAVPSATKPREVIQTDTVDFGELFAYTAVDICTREASVVLLPALTGFYGAVALTQQMEYFKHVELIQRDGGHEFKAEWELVVPTFANQVRTSRPYKKNEQAFIESFNRTLRKECLGWGRYTIRDLPRLQQKVQHFLHLYNTERPHLSLGMKAPATVCRI